MRIQKFYLEFDDPANGLMQYQMESLEGEGLAFVRLPFDLNIFAANYVRMEFYETAKSNPVVVEGTEKLNYLVLGEAVQPTNELREWKNKDRFLNSLLPADFEQASKKLFPLIRISDVTERDMFGYAEIPESRLGDKGGIWAWHGLRKLAVTVEDLEFDTENGFAGAQQRAALYFYKMDNEVLGDIIDVEDIRFNRRDKNYIAYLNTNRFGEAFKNGGGIEPTFKGRFELHLYQVRSKVVYSFPVDICVHDTRLNDRFENHLLDEHGVVSIDFGTSSTCAAVKGTGIPELITLSHSSEDDNRYENPTNLMIYDWNEFYRQWESSNPNCPFLIRKSENLYDSEVDYDSGYTVDDILKTITSDDRGRRRARAVVTELKTIPNVIQRKGSQLKIRPLNDIEGKFIKITDDFTLEDETTLNPIAFYGYLLSRAINNPVRQKIYRCYNITFPVKFSSDVREKIRSSFAYGIRRALPKPMTEAQEAGEPFIAVNMYYEEAVACAGAVVANQLVITDESPEAKPFAIFDLGGGTLDTAYGIFRKAVGDECETAEYTIQIFGCGGNERVGGEKLIHQIAYKIYLDNRAETENKKIPFVLPQGEMHPKGFDGLLMEVGDEIADANVSTLKENIARILFQHADLVDGKMTELFRETAPDGYHCRITLRNIDNVEVDLNMEVRDIDEFLEDKIKGTVRDFKADMDTICQSDRILQALKKAGIDGYNPEDFAIFLGGNASKQHYVEKSMRSYFPESRIERIKNMNLADRDNLNDRYILNGKTAVAFGQLNLESYYIDKSAYQINPGEERAPFPFYVGYIRPNDGKVKIVLNKDDNSREWKQANFITRENRMNICFTSAPQQETESWKPFNRRVEVVGNGKVLWLRVAPEAHNSIEYRVCNINETPADEPMDPQKVFELSE